MQNKGTAQFDPGCIFDFVDIMGSISLCLLRYDDYCTLLLKVSPGSKPHSCHHKVCFVRALLAVMCPSGNSHLIAASVTCSRKNERTLASVASQYCCLLWSPGFHLYWSEFDNDSISSVQFGYIQVFGYTENRRAKEKKWLCEGGLCSVKY